MTEQREVHRSSRDPAQMQLRLERWLAGKLPDGAEPAIRDLRGTSATGMSSETLLFDAAWTEGGALREEPLVARIAPDTSDVPVFPSYDLERQAQVMRLVRDQTSVPVPRVWWSEPRAEAIGAPFFVMERVEGEVPPDVMPYNFGDSWLFHAPREDQQRLVDSTIAVLAELHTIDAAQDECRFLELDEPGGTVLQRHSAHVRAWYEFCSSNGDRSPLIERAFGWIDDHWPAEEGSTVVSWGDSRIGNVMYRDFRPVAVFDWEMAALGPRELDVAWLIYGHRCFEDMATFFELGGMPHLLRREDVASTYESLTGYTLRDLDFFFVYTAVQWAIVFLRTGQRAIHFGDQDRPSDVDEMLRNREPLEQMLDGTYWS